jgi:hypothetical protein
MKKGDKVLSWENLDGPKGIGRGMALCEVVLVEKAKGCIQPFIKVRIRDPRGALWWTPPSSLKPCKVSAEGRGPKARVTVRLSWRVR